MKLNGNITDAKGIGGTINRKASFSGALQRGGGGGSVPEVFWAIYGTTTASEIRLAAEANKLVVCEHDGKIFYLGDVTISSVWFVNLSNRGYRVTTLRCVGSAWTSWTDDKTEDMVVVTFGQINLDDEGTTSTSTVTANKTAEALFTAHQSGKDVVGFAPVYVHDSLHGTNTAGYYVQFAMTSWEQPELDDPQNVVSFTGVFPHTETGSLVGVSGGRITLTATSGYTFSVTLDYGTPAYFTSDMQTKLANLTPYTSNPAMDGTASPGNSSAYARGNHVHPHDTSKLDAPSGGSVGQVLKKTANGTEWADNLTPTQIQDAVDDYLDDHPTVTGAFTNEAKRALISLLEKVAYIDGNGQSYLDTLESELFTASVSSISAVFTQGQNVIYNTDSLDTLKQYLVVTATYSDSTTATVPSANYTLSGTLTVGTSTITASYSGKSDTFTVSVTQATQDTTAEVEYENYVLEHTGATSGGSIVNRSLTNGGITIKYEMDSPTAKLDLAGIIPYTDATFANGYSAIVTYDSNGTYLSFVNANTSTAATPNRWAQLATGTMTEYHQFWTVPEFSQIAFSVDIRYLDDAYMYDGTTGQVFFAGINTPYYGMSNISEAS